MAKVAIRVMAAVAASLLAQLTLVQPVAAQSSTPQWTVVSTPQGPIEVAFRWPGDDSRERTRFTSQPRKRLRAPAAPSNVVAVDNGNRGARVTWVDNSTTATGFELERSPAFTSAVSVGAGVTQYEDPSGPGQYLYRVRAVNAAGASPYSAWATVIVSEIPPVAPSALAALNNGDGSTSLTWLDNSNNEVRFEIQRSPAFTVGVSVGSNISTYRDEPGPGTFAYRVRAVNAMGASEFTPWAWVNITTPVPIAPTNLAANANLNGTVSLSWSDNSGNETGFQVQRNPAFPGGLLLLSANTTNHVDVSGPGVFQYRVRAINASGGSDFTSWVSVSVIDPIPVAPSNVQAVDAGNRRAMVTWNDNSSNETGFEIQRNPAFQGANAIVGANVTGYIDQCGPGQWQYRVRALGVTGNSAFSGWASVTVAEVLPAAPSNVVLADLGNQSQVRVTWVDNSNNETGFKIQRETQSGSTWGQTQNFTAAENATVYTDSPGMGTHRYRVAATNSVGDSPWTAWSTITLAGGWTQFTPSTDTRVVYVSSSTGNDNNTGLSEASPKKTINAAYPLLRDGYPDWLLLKRGDTFMDQGLGITSGGTVQAWTKNGRSITEPMVIGSYGAGSTARPVIAFTTDTAMLIMSGGSTRDYLAIVGLEFYCYNRDPSHPSFTVKSGSPAIRRYKDGTYFHIEDCLFRYFSHALTVETGGTAGIKDIRFRRNVVADNYGVGQHSSGIYITMTDGMLVEENVFDRNGWYPGVAVSTIFNHNMYFYEHDKNKNITVRNNIVARASATGIQCRPGGTVTGNLCLYNPTNISMGHAQVNWPAFKPSGMISGNVIMGSGNINGDARGFGINMERVGSVTIRDNVIAHIAGSVAGPSNVMGIRAALEHELLTIEDNLIYRWDLNGGGLGLELGTSGIGLVIRANSLQFPGGGRVVDQAPSLFANHLYVGNKYFTTTATGSWFRVGGNDRSYSSWLGVSGEVGSSSSAVSYPSPERTIGTYAQSQGLAPTLDAFLTEARKQSRTSWRAEYAAPAVVQYIRQGFGLPN